ncbi:MAG: adenylosuccinate lyase [Candidatus Thermoplasmatota archaeon]
MICPIEFRYGRKEMKQIFTEERKLQYLLEVEKALAQAHAEFGNISKKDAEIISKKASPKFVKLERVKEIEKETKHDIMALVKALAERCGSAGKVVHLGATSYDIVDTANALQLKEALKIVEKDLVELRNSLVKLANKHKTTIMLGRTHGQAALPITFGLKIIVFAMEVQRHLERLRECRKRVTVGKLSGAVGTGAAFGKIAIEIQDFVMKKLALGAERASTQIVQRDRYIEIVSLLANIATSLEKFATEVRNLQRSEIMEVAEPFGKRQVGSSTMAQKRNPITCEKICGLARIVRSFITPTFESAIQWHERDLTNSSAERFIIPHSFILIDEILKDMKGVFDGLWVFPERMKKNLEEHPEVMSEALTLALVKKGLSRLDAYEELRKCSLEKDFKKAVFTNKRIKALLSKKELNELFKFENYLGASEKIILNCTKYLRAQ